jgi:hypothetical protein
LSSQGGIQLGQCPLDPGQRIAYVDDLADRDRLGRFDSAVTYELQQQARAQAAHEATEHEVFERSAQVKSKSLDYVKVEAGLTIRETDQAIAAAAARQRCGTWESGAADNYTDWLALSTRELKEK